MNAFYLADNDFCDVDLVLEGAEFHHLSKVLRLKVGTRVCVFNGQGKEAHCVISEITKKNAKLNIENRIEYDKPCSRLTLALAWGKAARRGFIFEKSVELEAHALWFWHANRSQFPLSEAKDSWQEQLIAGMKQCHNPFLPFIDTFPKGAQEIIDASKHFEHKHILVENDFHHDAFLDEVYLGNDGDTLCVIGPEGGFTEEEVVLFQKNGFLALSMGNRILRWETAAFMALGLHFWQKQKMINQ